MTTTEVLQVADIIECVKTWPATMRVTLARRILETIDAPSVPEPVRRQRGPTAAEVAAMFKIDKPAPSDEECQRILEEELSEKYMP